VNGVDDDWDRFTGFAEYDAFTREWLLACRRVMKETATLWVIGSYHNIHRVGAILMDLGFWILNEIAWVKTNPMPNFRGVRFTNAHETLLWVKKSPDQKRYTFNYHLMKARNDGKQMRSDWKIPVCGGSERLRVNGDKVHSTQKPDALLERVILSSTHPGDVVLDPFFGTGTAGAVAKRLGRRWIGIERDEAYARAARERIASVARPAPFDLRRLEEKREPRVPFAELIAAGLIPPGLRLHYNRSEEITATVLPDGRLQLGEFLGSIHQAGARAGRLPACNGWERWYVKDATTGEMIPLDHYRTVYRASRAGVESG
jgi:DNA modification methylase